MTRWTFALPSALLVFAPSAVRADDVTPAPVVAPSSAPPKPAAAPSLPTYDGVAAPPTAAGASGLPVTVKSGLEIIGQYTYRSTRDQTGASQWFHVFDVPRAHGSLDAAYDGVEARVVMEAVRSASEGALMGVAGDSLVLRVREAWGGARWPKTAGDTELSVEGKAGVVPTLTIPELEGTWRTRAVSATPLESTGVASPADVGATLSLSLPSRYGRVSVGAYNGEGYTNRELNRGKNFEAAVSVHPLASIESARPLAVFGSFVMGSSGTGLARANRATGALLWQGTKWRAGASYTYFWGVRDDGDQTGSVLDAFVRAEPVERLLFAARVAVWNRDTRATDADTLTTATGSVGFRIAQPLEGFLAIDRSLPSTRTESALPGTDYWTLRVVAHVAF